MTDAERMDRQGGGPTLLDSLRDGRLYLTIDGDAMAIDGRDGEPGFAVAKVAGLYLGWSRDGRSLRVENRSGRDRVIEFECGGRIFRPKIEAGRHHLETRPADARA